ncbi:hypothetical protein LINGRAPRIM_LOCUS1069 [Linum grandiflorum]
MCTVRQITPLIFLANYSHSLALGSYKVFLSNATLSRWFLLDHIRG